VVAVVLGKADNQVSILIHLEEVVVEGLILGFPHLMEIVDTLVVVEVVELTPLEV
tara:strand:+ start:775 stop:939 length:165 start_codon:yes stop_codon:yes gene_type:complete